MDFCKLKSCRRKYILNYFGENPSSDICQKTCDYCENPGKVENEMNCMYTSSLKYVKKEEKPKSYQKNQNGKYFDKVSQVSFDDNATAEEIFEAYKNVDNPGFSSFSRRSFDRPKVYKNIDESKILNSPSIEKQNLDVQRKEKQILINDLRSALKKNFTVLKDQEKLKNVEDILNTHEQKISQGMKSFSDYQNKMKNFVVLVNKMTDLKKLFEFKKRKVGDTSPPSSPPSSSSSNVKTQGLNSGFITAKNFMKKAPSKNSSSKSSPVKRTLSKKEDNFGFTTASQLSKQMSNKKKRIEEEDK